MIIPVLSCISICSIIREEIPSDIDFYRKVCLSYFYLNSNQFILLFEFNRRSRSKICRDYFSQFSFYEYMVIINLYLLKRYLLFAKLSETTPCLKSPWNEMHNLQDCKRPDSSLIAQTNPMKDFIYD